MTEQQIKDEVLRYIDDKAYNYAILIDGEWGSGKTYFVTKALTEEIKNREDVKEKPRQIKYISLYGCKSINDVQENIAWSFAENARDKINDKANWGKRGETVSGNVLLSSKKIGNAILKKYLSETSIYEIASDWLNLGAFIFIIDDLERCDCSLNEVFGFLNELVEHENTKVIIVANEKEISGIAESQNLELQYQLVLDDKIEWPKDDESNFLRRDTKKGKVSFNEIEWRRRTLFPKSDVNETYKKIREKLIGVTLRYEPNVIEIISEIVESSAYDSQFKKMLLEKRKFFSNTMDHYHHHNLRTFQFFLSKVSYLLEQLSEIELDDDYKERIIDKIITETFDQAVRFKANYKPDSDSLFGLTREQDSTSIFIEKYVENGEFIYDAFKEDVLKIQEQLKADIPNDDPYYLLYRQYYCNTQEWCEEQLRIIINQIQNNKYPVSFYEKIIVVVQRLLNLGFDDDYMQQIMSSMIANISSMGEVKALDDNLWMIEDVNLKEKTRAIITEINDAIVAHSANVRASTVKEILKKDDWISGLEQYINPDNTYYPREVPIFSKADVEQWVQKLHEANPEEIDDFRHWLVKAYPRNQTRKNYSQDADSIKEIKKRLQELEETDLIKRACTGWLVNQLQEIIECNEPELLENDVETYDEVTE